MKKGIIPVLIAALWLGGALAQTQPSTQTSPTPQVASQDQDFMLLANRINGFDELLKGDIALSNEQAQKLLPYFMAIRSSAAITPLMAKWYSDKMDQILSEPQKAALESKSDMAAQSTDNATQATPAPTDTATTPTDTAATSDTSTTDTATTTDTAETTPETAPTDTATTDPATTDTATTDNPADTATTDTSTDAANPDTTTDTTANTTPTDTAAATENTETATTETTPTTEATTPSTDDTMTLNLQAQNPFQESPIVARLDQLIQQLKQTSQN